MARGTRPRRKRIEVWCSDDEFALLKANAQMAGMSNSEYLRNVGNGCRLKSTFDSQSIDRLAKLHADQGRLGDMLKLCLSNKECGAIVNSVRSLLKQIESLQMVIARVVMQEARRL